MKQAREILSDRNRWTSKALRRRTRGEDGRFDQSKERYCLVGAMERATYELGLATSEGRIPYYGQRAIGYQLADEIGLNEHARKTRETSAWGVNDAHGYLAALELLDEFICETQSVVKPRGKPAL